MNFRTQYSATLLGHSTALFYFTETALRFVHKYASSRVYLATDNADTQSVFLAHYRGRIRIGRKISHKGALRQTSLFDAAVDLLTCAAAEVFKGSYSSSFSDTIAHLRTVNGRNHPEDEHTFA